MITTPHQRRLVAKIGSQVLCQDDGSLDTASLSRLVDQVAHLKNDGWQVLMVSSGAVAAGSGVAGNASSRLADPVTRKQVLAAAGQVRLMETYQQQFRRHQLNVAQILASKSDFQSRQHYLNMRNCVEGLLASGLIPIVNENDVVSVTELMFTDNDELAGLMAGMVSASHLCLLSSVEGVLDADGEVISCWDESVHSGEAIVKTGTSSFGRGGMHSKIQVARKTAGLGTQVTISDGRASDVLVRVAGGEQMGTLFPASGSATPAKRWLASMDDHTRGTVYINAGAEQALVEKHRLASLLPIGIVRVEGEFQRGDVIQLRNEDNRVLGCGRAQYDHRDAIAAVGKHEQKPLIHYDYLYLVS